MHNAKEKWRRVANKTTLLHKNFQKVNAELQTSIFSEEIKFRNRRTIDYLRRYGKIKKVYDHFMFNWDK